MEELASGGTAGVTGNQVALPTQGASALEIVQRNYDLVGSASTAGVLLIVHAPWPIWAIWVGIVSYQVVNRIAHRRAQAPSEGDGDHGPRNRP